jgi:putative peptidoglycan lipid II flippase
VREALADVKETSSGQVARAAGAMGVATLLSRIMGLVREQVFAVFFGAGFATDAFNVAFRIPNLLRDLFAEGAMSSALVPVFTRVREQEGQRRAWRVAGLLFRVLFCLVFGIACIGIGYADRLVELYAGSFHAVTGKWELTVFLTRLLFPFFPLVALAAAFMGVLNASGKFFWPAFASALFNVASVVFGGALAFLLDRYLGVEPIVGMALGVVLGGAVQAFCQLPVLYRSGYQFPVRDPAIDPPWHRDPALRQILALMVPGIIGLAATQINVLVNTVLATSQGEGAVSYLNYAFRLMQFPIGVFGVSFAAATLPEISRLWVAGEHRTLTMTLERSLARVFALNVPAAFGLASLGFPIILLLFGYGRFTPADAWATAGALAAYSLGLPAYSAVKVLVPACYAVGITRIAVISSGISVALTILLNLLLVQRLGFVGLALGTSLAAILNLIFLLAAFRRKLKGCGVDWSFRPLGFSFGSQVLLGLVMAGAALLLFEALGGRDGHIQWGLSGRSLAVLFEIGISLGVLAGCAQLFRVRDTTEALHWFSSRIGKKLERYRRK